MKQTVELFNGSGVKEMNAFIAELNAKGGKAIQYLSREAAFLVTWEDDD